MELREVGLFCMNFAGSIISVCVFVKYTRVYGKPHARCSDVTI